MDTIIREIADAEKESLSVLYTDIVQSEFPEYSPRVRNYFTSGTYRDQMLTKPIRLGAFIDNQLIGFLLAGNPDGGVVFLFWLGITSAYRGKGIGKKLIARLEEIAKTKGAHNIQLQSDHHNLPFYQSVGFDIIGLDTKGFYGADSYLLKKLIQEPQEDTWFN